MKYNQLKIIALSIWWGAFTFYAGIVVPLGMRVLGSHTEMGFITQQVTVYLNVFSLIIFLFYAYCLHNEVFTANSLVEQIIVISIIGFQLLLFLLHNYQTDLLDFEHHKIINRDNFYLLHRIYLIIETLIWIVVSFVLVREILKIKHKI
jgi:hypothetical protein